MITDPEEVQTGTTVSKERRRKEDGQAEQRAETNFGGPPCGRHHDVI